MSNFKPYKTFFNLFLAGNAISAVFSLASGGSGSRLLAVFIVNMGFFVVPGSLLLTRLLSWKTGNGFLPARRRTPKPVHVSSRSDRDEFPHHMVDEVDPYKGGLCEGWYSGFDPWDFMYKKKRKRRR